MAHYAAVVSVVQLLHDIIHRDLYREILLPRQGIVESLYDKFSLLLETLEDYASKSGDEASQRIRDVADRAQDILVSDSRRGRWDWEWDPMLDEELVKVVEQVDSAAEELFGLKDLQLSNYYRYASSSSSATASELFPLGRAPVVEFDEEQFIQILDQLTGYPLELQPISIVGMAGIGKTTLATHLFHHKLIDSHFECRAWVTVSQNIYINQLLQKFLNSLGVHDDDGQTIDLLNSFDERVMARSRERIVEVLLPRRYLIVVDDLQWMDYWDFLKQIFPDNGCGSRIVLTTRSDDMAHYACRDSFIHKIPFLNENQSWSLLQQMVFLQEHCPPDMEDVGRLVASKCSGLVC